jgi:hypothetical protein
LSNNEVTFEAVHAPHARQTRLRCQEHDHVLVLHDTTIVKFSGEREGLGRIYEAGAARGFFVGELRGFASRASCLPSRPPWGCWLCETLHVASPKLPVQRCLRGNCSCCARIARGR